MVINYMVNGMEDFLMIMEHLFILMEAFIQANTRKVNGMVREF